MIVLINNPVIQTYIFSAIFFLALLLSFRKKQNTSFFGIDVSQELKGLAILTIIFAHVTYALVSDNKFLAPLSSLAGVGVNLFLILSGYGLVASALKKPLSVRQFYKHRLLNLFVPLWICLIIFFALDYFFLHLNYGAVYVAKAFFGLFTHANLYEDVNAPFWFFTWIVMYYLLFPLLYIKKYPWISAILMYLLPLALIKTEPHYLDYVIYLYKIHVIAFPLGMWLSWFLNSSKAWVKIKNRFIKIRYKNIWHYFSIILLSVAIIYLYKNSGVGKSPFIEEIFSIIACLLLIALFIIKRFEVKLLYWIGIFSYEIYILHWPLMYRYDMLFKYLPAWLALTIYLPIFIGLGYLLRFVIMKGRKIFIKQENK